jgi:hypothetical protein
MATIAVLFLLIGCPTLVILQFRNRRRLQRRHGVCAGCGGSGKLASWGTDSYGNSYHGSTQCPSCHGTGARV